MDARNTLPIGHILGDDYQIAGILGAGGFGNTYLARDSTLSRDVAIKEYCPRDITRRDESLELRVTHARFEHSFSWGRERFIQEAKLLAKFRHPNIVRVFRTLDANNTSYIVLDYVRGQELDHWLRALGRRPTQEEIDELLAPLVDALDVVHRVGVLHRDIKPANIVIREETGAPILLDFGASKYSLGEMTGTTMAIVSRGYSPYEAYAADSGSQGAWTDIYGLGATVYRALSEIVPPEATERLLDDTMVPLVNSGLSEYRKQFLEAVDWALKVQPKARPQSVPEWRTALFRGADAKLNTWQRSLPKAQGATLDAQGVSTALPAKTTTAEPTSSAKSKSAPVAILAGLTLLAAGGGYAAYHYGMLTLARPTTGEVAATAATGRDTSAMPEVAAQKPETGENTGNGTSPGQQAALMTPPPTAPVSAVKPSYKSKTFALGKGAEITTASVALDGTSIIFGDNLGGVRQIDIASGAQTTLATLSGLVTAVDLVGEEHKLVAAAIDDGSIVLVDGRSRSVRKIGKGAGAGGFVKTLSYSALTGEVVAVDTKLAGARLTRWATAETSTGPKLATDITGGLVRAASISRGRDLAVIVTADERVGGYRYTTGEQDEAFAWVAPAKGWTLALALSPDAQLLARGGQYASVEVFDAQSRSRKLEIDLGDQASVRSLAFSSDGQRLAIDYTTHVNAVALHRLRIVETENGRQVADILRGDDADRWLAFLPAAGEYWIASASSDTMQICSADDRCKSASPNE